MQAIRFFEKVNSNQLLINLPNDFNEDFVEVIILPFKSEEHYKKNNTNIELQKKILEAPIMNDTEFNEFNEKRNSLNQWKQ